MNTASKPDLTRGVAIADLVDGQAFIGVVGSDEAMLIRRGERFFCVAAQCTHYHGPLADGLIVEDTVRCPWHHACFDLRTGAVLRAPALDAIACWRVERDGERVFVRERLSTGASSTAGTKQPTSIVVVGGGAAGLAAVQTLRQEGYRGALTLISADKAAPYDRPNLSKDFLAGSAPPEWLPLRAEDFYREQRIELRLNSVVSALDPSRRQLQLADGERLEYEGLLLATGAEPLRLTIEGARPDQILTLRTLADCQAILARIGNGERVVVLGASFIALEVASALRARNIEVDIVGREQIPMARVLGDAVGSWVRSLHESHGVKFHLDTTVTRMDAERVTLANGETIAARWLIAGLGVRPLLALAEAAQLRIDRGVLVDEYLQTSISGVYAAGDIARWPDVHSGQSIRVEHWVVAERQGQVAARNLLGQRCRFEAVPFFWSQHYDATINYVGHAERWDAIETEGSVESRDCLLRFTAAGRVLAVASIGRDLASLQAELAMERESRARSA